MPQRGALELPTLSLNPLSALTLLKNAVHYGHSHRLHFQISNQSEGCGLLKSSHCVWCWGFGRARMGIHEKIVNSFASMSCLCTHVNLQHRSEVFNSFCSCTPKKLWPDLVSPIDTDCLGLQESRSRRVMHGSNSW